MAFMRRAVRIGALVAALAVVVGVVATIVGAASTGGTTFHPIDPVRAFDSRVAAYPESGILAPNASRVIPVKDGHDFFGNVTLADAVPPGATAVSYNLTVTGPTGPNFVAITPGDAAALTTSAMNFDGTHDDANAGIVAVDGTRSVKVWNGIEAGSTHFIVDITGYFMDEPNISARDRTVFVGGGASEEANGQALLDAVEFVNTHFPSAVDPWLIKLEPGIYDVGASDVFIGNGVSLAGSGEGVTRITGSAVVISVQSDSASIADLTSETTGIGFESEALEVNGTLLVTDSRFVGVASTIDIDGGTVTFDGVTFDTPGANDIDLLSVFAGTVTVRESTLLGIETSDGVIRALGSSTLTITNSFIEDDTSAVAGMATCRGVATATGFLTATCP